MRPNTLNRGLVTDALGLVANIGPLLGVPTANPTDHRQSSPSLLANLRSLLISKRSRTNPMTSASLPWTMEFSPYCPPLLLHTDIQSPGPFRMRTGMLRDQTLVRQRQHRLPLSHKRTWLLWEVSF